MLTPVKCFLQFCSHQGRTRFGDPIDFDMSLVEWVEHLCHDGESKSLANDTRSAVLHYFAQLKGHLHGFQRVLKAWSKHELPNRAPPLPTQFLLALAGKALTMGHTRFAVLLLVACHAFLRTQELLMVQASHFVLGVRNAPVLLTLPTSKPGQRLQDEVVISDATVVAYIRAVVPKLRQGGRLWPQSAASFSYFSNDCVPTLVFLPSAGGHTHCDVEGPQRTFWNAARWTKLLQREMVFYQNRQDLHQAQITLTALQQTAIDKHAKFILQLDMLKR